MSAKVKVKNLHDGERTPLWYPSWIDYWLDKNENYEEKPICPRCNENKSTDGSHVIKVDSSDKRWYIIPLCEKCNEKKDDKPFYVDKNLLVLASQNNS